MRADVKSVLVTLLAGALLGPFRPGRLSPLRIRQR